VLDVVDRDVAVTREYRGFRRMTLTYPALDRAGEAVWLVTGQKKRPALRRLLEGDTSLPSARVHTPRQTVIADELAQP
jgi:6-phosphogluconolactonase